MTVMGPVAFLHVGTAVLEIAVLMLSASESGGCQLSVVFIIDKLFLSSPSEMCGIGDDLSAQLKDEWSSGIDSVVSFVTEGWKRFLLSNLDSLVAMMKFKKVCASSKEDM